MDDERTQTLPLVEWHVAARAFPGQSVSGDHYVIRSVPTGVLVAVIDALGHGEEAANVAGLTAKILEEAASEPITVLFRQCHERLVGTRGVALSLASFNGQDNTVSWLGVGNVDGSLLRVDPAIAHESMLVRAGVVGYQLPRLRDSGASIKFGDILVMTTDGIRDGFTQDLSVSNRPRQIAEYILDHYAKDTDDALVLVVRYCGDKS